MILVKQYERPFGIPLQTSRGIYSHRTGWLLYDDQRECWAEIAPWPEFGSESLEDVRGFLNERTTLSLDEVEIPANLPATAFAFDCLKTGPMDPDPKDTQPTAQILSITEDLDTDSAQSGKCLPARFKIKIGIRPASEEIERIRSLGSTLPRNVKLRLDANQALTAESWATWQQFLEDKSWCEYVEEPLPSWEISLFDLLQDYRKSPIPIALDESLQYPESWNLLENQDWPGFLVIKPSIMGSTQNYSQAFLEKFRNRIVLSSVFETGIGLFHLLRLQRLWNLSTIPGLGTQRYFDDSLKLPELENQLTCPPKSILQQIWNRA